MNRVQPQSLFLLLLTMTSGCVDVITFLNLGQVFSAAMTGNTVLFGLAFVHTPGLSVIRYVTALCGFMLGNALAALLCSRVQRQSGWNLTLNVVLIGEFALLLTSALLMDLQSPISTNFLVLLFSAAMGMQGVVARRVGINGITTTVITSTITGMVETTIWNLQSKARVDFDEKKTVQTNSTPWSTIILWFSAIAIYGVGAALCGEIQRHSLRVAVWLPVLVVLLVILLSYVWQTAKERKQKAHRTVSA